MFKYFILACFCCILSSTVWANTPSQFYSELTNLDTQEYVWKVEFRSNPQGQFDAKLSNPHPKFAVLNQRAMEIAEDYKQKLQNYKHGVVASDANYTLSGDGRTRVYQEPYILEIQFPLLKNKQDIRWKIKPKPVIKQHELSTMCNEIAQSGQVILKFKVTTKLNGRIGDVALLSHSQYNDNFQKMALSLGDKAFRFGMIKPRNKDGVPYSISFDVPMAFDCPVLEQPK